MTDGVLNVNKPAGFTSHDVVAKLRGILRQKKIGHTGTLDPDATGVLPVCLGKATRLCQFLTDETKSYEAVLLLGQETDTQDAGGHVTAVHPADCTEEEFREAAYSFRGPQMQIPPMYSALKKDGKKLYELARAGIEIERDPRPVIFYEIEILDISLPRARLHVTCSKGTYIRTLCHDIGTRLGCGACMESLVRTRVGRFRLEDAVTLEEISKAAGEGRLAEYVVSVEEMFSHLPCAVTDPSADRLSHNGNKVPVSKVYTENGQDTGGISAGDDVQVRLYDSGRTFIGIFVREGDCWKPRQMFRGPDKA